MIHPYSASRDRGWALIAAGCPIDYLNNLPCDSDRYCKRLYIRQLVGYADSRFYELGPFDAGFVVALRLGTDTPSGIVVAGWRWSFVPSCECDINWDCDACDVVPKRDHFFYEKLFTSHLSEKLNERRLLARGRPVDGLLCGRILDPPERFARAQIVHAKLTVTDTKGYSTTLSIQLNVHRSFAAKLGARTNKCRRRLLDKPDFPVVRSE